MLQNLPQLVQVEIVPLGKIPGSRTAWPSSGDRVGRHFTVIEAVSSGGGYHYIKKIGDVDLDRALFVSLARSSTYR